MIYVVCHRVWTAARPVLHRAWRHVGHAAGHVVAHPIAAVVSIVCVAVPGTALWLLPPPAAAPVASIIPPVGFAPGQGGVRPSDRGFVPQEVPPSSLFPPSSALSVPSSTFSRHFPPETRHLPPEAFLPPDVRVIPEPSTLLVFGVGVLALLVLRKRRG